MPPALSDYGSDSDFGFGFNAESEVETEEGVCVEDVEKRSPSRTFVPEAAIRCCQSDTRLQSKKPTKPGRDIKKTRKRKHLLLGLDLDNIIVSQCEGHQVPDDDLPVSSNPLLQKNSSYTTRGSTNKTRSREPLYDQQYHPMDDVVRPSQAAKHRNKYEVQLPDSHSTIYEERNVAESESEVEDGALPSKRRKALEPPQSSGTRRSSRQVTRDVLYNAQVHPQDEDLQRLEASSESEDSCVEELSDLTSGTVNSNGVEPREIPETDAETIHGAIISSPPRSTPLSSIVVGSPDPFDDHHARLGAPSGETESPPPAYASRRRGPKFKIYQEPVSRQLAREAASPAPLQYDHDDKENEGENQFQEGDNDPLFGLTVHTPAELDKIDEQIDIYSVLNCSPYSSSLYTFDGSNENHHDPCFSPQELRRVLIAEALASGQIDRDSLLGTPSPDRSPSPDPPRHVINGSPSNRNRSRQRNSSSRRPALAVLR